MQAAARRRNGERKTRRGGDRATVGEANWRSLSTGSGGVCVACVCPSARKVHRADKARPRPPERRFKRGQCRKDEEGAAALCF